VAIEMVADRQRRTRFPWQERRGLRLYRHALARGVLLRPIGDVVYLMPPYVISDEEADLLVRTALEGVDIACA
jgi:adenosylmethionine-8-amino-7-oxononanoate aminotransferase